MKLQKVIDLLIKIQEHEDTGLLKCGIKLVEISYENYIVVTFKDENSEKKISKAK